MKKMYLVVGAILLMILIGSCVYLFTSNRKLKKETEATQLELKRVIGLTNITTDRNKRLIDSLSVANRHSDSVINQFKQSLAAKRAEQQEITNKYKKLQNEIRNTADSGQSAITKKLLSEYERYK